jgi:hypothetical protein
MIMRMKTNLIIVLVVSAFFVPSADAVTTGADFLRSGIGARPTGMGEAAVAVFSDVTSACWNPAGLSGMERKELAFMHGEAMQDASLEFLGFAYPAKKYGVFAVSGIFYLNNPIPLVDENQVETGELSWLYSAFIFSFAGKLGDSVSAGASLKLIHDAESDPVFGRNEGNTGALDLGVIYASPVRGLDLGLALLNSGPPIRMSGETRNDELPLSARCGVAYQGRLDDAHSILLALDLNRILEGGWYAGAGVELSFRDVFSFRTGYFSKEGSIAGLTYGFGFKSGDFRLDYSNVPNSEMLGATRSNKISLSTFY